MLSNVVDIESYIKYQEEQHKDTFLQIIDIPLSEYEIVKSELRLMGITAASMLPGLDGTCEAMKENLFGFTSS